MIEFFLADDNGINLMNTNNQKGVSDLKIFVVGILVHY